MRFIVRIVYHLRDPNKEQVNGEIMLLDEWPVYTIEDRKYLRLQTNLVHGHNKKKSIGIGPKLQDCAFWNEYLPLLIRGTGMLRLSSFMFKTKIFRRMISVKHSHKNLTICTFFSLDSFPELHYLDFR